MSKRVSRRSFLATTGVTGSAALAGCTGAITGSTSDGPIKLGAAVPLAGALATYGEGAEPAFEFVRTQIGETILDREYEIITRDTKTEPSTGLQKTKELVENENVDALMGVSSSSVYISILPYLKNEAKLPFVTENVSGVAVREDGEYCNEYSFFPFVSSRQMALPHAKFIKNVLPNHEEGIDTSKVAFIYADYTAGQEALRMFKEEFDGDVTTEVAVPPGTKDYSSYLPDLSSADADIVHGFLPGVAGIQFVSQANDFGLKEEKTIVLSGDMLNQLSVGALGSAANGVYGTHWYNSLGEAEMNTAYKSWHTENMETPPNSVVVANVNMLYSLVQGIERAGTTDTDEVISAMEGMSYDSPMGTLTTRPSDHQTEMNFFGFEIQDGGYSPLEEYTDVIGPANCNL
jgi:branched-chain amino acid transport system substrate-binding protein